MAKQGVTAAKESWVLVYDNAPQSLANIRPALEQAHQVSVHKSIAAFAQKLESIRKSGGAVAFVILDMHDERVKDLGKLRRPTIQTQNGTAVGLAMTQHFLWDSSEGFGSIPVLILSARSIPEDAEKVIEEFRSAGRPIESAQKDEDADAIIQKTELFDVVDYASDVELTDEEIITTLKINAEQASKWGFADSEIISLFGYSPKKNKSVEQLIGRIALNPSKDDETRMHLFIDLRLGLETFFATDDFEAHQSFLDEKQKKFGGQSTRELLVSGTISDVFTVVYFIRDRVR